MKWCVNIIMNDAAIINMNILYHFTRYYYYYISIK